MVIRIVTRGWTGWGVNGVIFPVSWFVRFLRGIRISFDKVMVTFA